MKNPLFSWSNQMRLLFRYDYTIYGDSVDSLDDFFYGFLEELAGEEAFVQQVILTAVFQDYSTLFRDYQVSPFSSDPGSELEQRIRVDLEDLLVSDGTACVTIVAWGQ